MTFRLSLVALGLAGWLTASPVAAQDVEVLARGPVHEAYAEPSEREPKPTPVIPKEPPRPIEELPPDQKPEGENVQWMPGYWAWEDERKDFLWVSGFWRSAPPDRAWVPGSWRQSGDGWQWVGGFWAAAEGEKAQVEYLPQPPAPLDEAGPATPAPSESHLYVPGTWVYRERYVWRPGFWCEHNPGWVWTAAHYRWTPAGYVFIDGYWDYPLADRGILFAPVYIPPPVYAAPTFVYTPSYVVQETALFGSFFCRRGYGSYYFGDYFAPSYASVGFTAWCGNIGVSVGFGFGRWHDPLFSYYRCGYRSDPFWGGGGIYDLYAGRYRGDYLRPPVNLVQQNTVINNITNNNTNTNVNVTNVSMVNSLNNVARSGRRNLQPVAEPTRRQFAQSAQASRETASRRARTEAELASRPGAGGRTAPARRAALDVPTAPTVGGKGSLNPPGKGGLTPPGKGGIAAKNSLAPPAPPRPAPARIAPRTPKGSATGQADRPVGPGVPKLNPNPGTNPVAPRANQKPPVASRPGPGGPKVNPGLRPTPEANTLPGPKSPALPKAGPGVAPKVNPVVPKANPVVPKSSPVAPRPNPVAPKSNPVLPPRANPVAPRPNLPAARPVLPPSAKPTPPRPPVSVPKPPSLPAAPRNLAPQPRFNPPAAVPRANPAPRIGPAAPPARPAAPPARPAVPPKKGKG